MFHPKEIILEDSMVTFFCTVHVLLSQPHTHNINLRSHSHHSLVYIQVSFQTTSVEEWEMKPSEGDVNISISKLQIYFVHKHMLTWSVVCDLRR